MRKAGKDSPTAEVLSATIRYFPDEGRHHRLATFRACRARLKAGDIKKLVIFTLDGAAVLEALKTLGLVKPQIIAVSFPPETRPAKDEAAPPIQAGITGEMYTRLRNANVTIVQGTMPLREIVIPNDRDVKIEAIRRTLWLMSGGVELCIEGVLMACDAGWVLPGEVVMACSADTAITARASRTSRLLTDFEIQEIICKPRRLTITRRALYEKPPPK